MSKETMDIEKALEEYNEKLSAKESVEGLAKWVLGTLKKLKEEEQELLMVIILTECRAFRSTIEAAR